MSDYNRIEKAMVYMSENALKQPTLGEVAAHVHLSPFHFQRIFCRWAGTTPKRFLQAITLERGKRLLEGPHSLLDASLSIGLSSGSRLYDHFVQLEAVTPGEYKNKGKGVSIEYGFHKTPLGQIFAAVTQRGICRMEFADYTSTDTLLTELRKDWPRSELKREDGSSRYVVDALFHSKPDRQCGPLSLYVAGTNFQIAVWRALLRIPPNNFASYSQIAKAIGHTEASRAVGNAVGSNPVALLIPCHRVIQQSGALGGYRWGPAKKLMVQTWEQVHHEFAGK